MAGVLSRLWVRGRAGRVHIPCPPRFLLAIKIAGIVGHKMHVFAIPGYFYGSYPDGGTLGYELSLRGPAPKAEKEPRPIVFCVFLPIPRRVMCRVFQTEPTTRYAFVRSRVRVVSGGTVMKNNIQKIRRERWKLVPEAVPTVRRNCSKCKEKREFINSMKFRVNANGKNVDVWLIYRCEKCSTTWNMSIFERSPVSAIPEEEYAGFQANDRLLAESYGRRMDLFVKNRAEAVTPEGGYRIEAEAESETGAEECAVAGREAGREAGGEAGAEENVLPAESGFRRIELEVPFPMVLRLDSLLADRLGVSRSMVKRWCGQGVVVKLDREENVWKSEERLCREKVRNGLVIGIRPVLSVPETVPMPQVCPPGLTPVKLKA